MFAAKEGQFSGNGEDFLVTNDGTNTRSGRASSTAADSTTRPKDGSVSGTVFEDTNANGVMDGEEKPMGGVPVFVDLDGDGAGRPGAEQADE